MICIGLFKAKYFKENKNADFCQKKALNLTVSIIIVTFIR